MPPPFVTVPRFPIRDFGENTRGEARRLHHDLISLGGSAGTRKRRSCGLEQLQRRGRSWTLSILRGAMSGWGRDARGPLPAAAVAPCPPGRRAEQDGWRAPRAVRNREFDFIF